ncbi:hypothetical protein PISMIDRAFT_679219 [Pisolithus microcarpus 441]|uniref:Uncharacterized protein n=1 Tax=Pisolithus microcarpus 441 TaxID=765257 RepID=A0A0C9ZC90_9AGAM|nr:hypothetical protein PISMIDRAFT_679219 [Pisolithus microcarpus 441]
MHSRDSGSLMSPCLWRYVTVEWSEANATIRSVGGVQGVYHFISFMVRCRTIIRERSSFLTPP